MSEHQSKKSKNTRSCDEVAAKHRHGKDAVVVRLGQINIVHLDRPSPETIRKRTEEIMREKLADEAFFDDCPLCQEMKRHPYDVVYYDQESEEESWQ